MCDIYIYRIIKKIQNVVLILPEIYNRDEWLLVIEKNKKGKDVIYRLTAESLEKTNTRIFTRPVFKDEPDLIRDCDTIYNKFKRTYDK